MITKNHKATVCSTLIVSLICTLLIVASFPSLTQAAPPALPPRPPNLPPRPMTPPPLPPSPSKSGAGSESPDGGHIELRVQSTQAGLWTIVQWQDGLGDWHDIEGWQGMLDEGHKKVWWVAPKDFGTGPFRWMVYQGQRGKELAQSELFYLPSSAGETVKIEASLVPSQPKSISNSTLPSPSPD
jgi:hypothetical protein